MIKKKILPALACVLFLATPAMAQNTNRLTSQLPPSTTFGSAESVLVVTGAATKATRTITGANLLQALSAFAGWTGAVTNALPAVLTNAFNATGPISSTAGTRTFTNDSTHTVTTNTATLTSHEVGAGQRFEWYNGTKTITMDPTNGLFIPKAYGGQTNKTVYMTVFPRGNTLLVTNAAFNLTFPALVDPTAWEQSMLIVSNSGATFDITIAGVNNQASVTVGCTNGQYTYIARDQWPMMTNVVAWDSYKARLK